jgi:hypothetical protein
MDGRWCSITRVEETCGQFFIECVLFIDVLHEHPDQSAMEDMQRWSAEGTLVLASHPNVGTRGSEEEMIFIEMVRIDLSVALDISADYIAVIDIETPVPYPTEQPPTGALWFLLTYSVTNDVSEVGVLRQIHSIEHQSKQPGSLLLQGDATSTVISAGEVDHEISLHPCTPVYLGPDVGFVDILQWTEVGNECSLNMPELERVCGHFYTECLRYLFPEEDCVEGLTIANSDRIARNPCAGVVGAACEYTCNDGYTATGTHLCSPTGSFRGGSCTSCTDGVSNGDETGVDCGGSCHPCRICASAVLNSLTDCSGTRVDAICAVQCNPGFVLSGEFLCGLDGQFSGGVCNHRPAAIGSDAGQWFACTTQDPSADCASYRDDASCEAAWVQDGQDCVWQDVGHAPDPVGSVIIGLTLTIDIASVPTESLVMGGVIRDNPARFAWVELLLGELQSVMQCEPSRLRFDSVNAGSVVVQFVIFPGTPDALSLLDVLAQAILDPSSPFCAPRHCVNVLPLSVLPFSSCPTFFGLCTAKRTKHVHIMLDRDHDGPTLPDRPRCCVDLDGRWGASWCATTTTASGERCGRRWEHDECGVHGRCDRAAIAPGHRDRSRHGNCNCPAYVASV